MATIKQRVAAKKIAENLRKPKGKRKSLQKIMLESGYSEETSKAPQNLTSSKSFQELLDEMIPNDMVVETQKILLKAVKIETFKFPIYLSDEEIRDAVEDIEGHKLRKVFRNEQKGVATAIVWVRDGIINDKALDKVYKLRGQYAAEKHEITGNIDVIEINNYGTKSKK